MKTLQKTCIVSLVVLCFLAFAGSTQAATLSQSNVYLSMGQSSTVYASNVSTYVYLSSNSNSNVASVSVNGNNINIYGITTGSTTAVICENNIGNCSSIFITVSGNGNNNYGTLSLSQSNLSLSIGQTSVVTAYNNASYYNSYTALYISSNPNPNVATASVSGNNVSIYANNVGSDTILVCQNNGGSSCGSIYVTVAGGYYGGYANNNSALNLTVSNLVLPVGSNATVSSANSVGTYVSTNSNPNVASTLNVGSTSGTSGCAAGAQYSTFTGQPCYGQTNNGGYYSASYIPGCLAGYQYSALTGQSCYNNYNNNYNGQVIGGNTSIEILAAAAGTDTITFCQSGGAICSSIYVTVF